MSKWEVKGYLPEGETISIVVTAANEAQAKRVAGWEVANDYGIQSIQDDIVWESCHEQAPKVIGKKQKSLLRRLWKLVR